MPRANVLGVGIHAVSPQSAVEIVRTALASDRKGYVCVTGVHGVMEAQKDLPFRSILNSAFLVTPDGMPTVWVGRMQGHACMARVFGPDLMLDVCRASVAWGARHFLYGGADGVAEQLATNLRKLCPGISIVGTYTPPFRPLLEGERYELQNMIETAAPDIVWVGLSTPKQEKFMAEYLPLLRTKLMIGVGAAFDLHTGRIKDCDDWMKRAGLQWFHRLCQEPRRLWKRYLINNPKFLFAIAAQLAGLRTYTIPPEQPPKLSAESGGATATPS
ncbi:MAG TPA: WecB/TagA/CpsF family glycosyltransferase [Terriglobales bacterium]|nr:WecB/TagA/CpsF family glycosyltransferase [Terriglobales bacterium]